MMTLLTDAMTLFLSLSARSRRCGRHEIAHVPRDREPRAGDGEAGREHRHEAGVLRDRPARGGAEERPEELYARIDSRGRARGLARRRARHPPGPPRSPHVQAPEAN